MTAPRFRPCPLLIVLTMTAALCAQVVRPEPRKVTDDASTLGAAEQADNPYKLQPFHPDFPSQLEYPPMVAREYHRTRRQVLQQLASNLQGNVRRDTWQIATEFFWRAPQDAVDPLIEAMDRAMGNPVFGDVVRNCVDAMGKMATPEFDAALQRALQHKNEAVRQQAYVAMTFSSTDETLLRLRADFGLMNGRAREAWLAAVNTRLPTERVELFRKLMMSEYPGPVRDQVMKQTVTLPAAEAATVLKGRWSEAVDEFKAIIAGVLHAAGDAAGTAWLLDALGSDDSTRMVTALRHCIYGSNADQVIGPLRELLLRASTHLRPEVRLEAAAQLTRLSGDDVADVLEVLTAPDEVWEIRAMAIRELTRRGRTEIVSVLLDELRTATGTRLRSIINQLSASGDPRAVPELVKRFESAPEGEGRQFVQAIAQNASEAAAKGLCVLFDGPIRLIARSDTRPLTTRNYIPLLLLNLRGSERVVVEHFLALPKDSWELRSLLMPTVIGYAMDRRDQPELQKMCVEPVRAIMMDPAELPQLRVQALNLLSRNWLTIEDVMRLQTMRRKEAPGMRALFGNFLVDAF